MLRKITYIIVLTIIYALFIVSQASAQQDARYSQYMFNKLVINPAYAGSAGATALDVLGRYQWVNIDGSPKTISASLHGPVGNAQNVGLGAWAEAEMIGVHQRIRLYGVYSYRFRLTDRVNLSAGIQAGALGLNSDFSTIKSAQDVLAGDPIYTTDRTKIQPNFGMGLYLYSKGFYLGASVPHLLVNNLYDFTDTGGGVMKLSPQERHYYLMGGVVAPLGKNLKAVPSFLLKTTPGHAPIQFDTNLSFLIKETLWLGSSFRFTDQFDPESIDFLIGFNIGNEGYGKLKPGNAMRIGYAFDYTLTKLNNKTSGSHEIMLGFEFGGNPGRYRTPRYF